MFETFNVSGLYIAVQAVLGLAASWTTNNVRERTLAGTVVDSGYGVTHVILLVEGYVIGSCIEQVLRPRLNVPVPRCRGDARAAVAARPTALTGCGTRRARRRRTTRGRGTSGRTSSSTTSSSGTRPTGRS